jgi:hypothetical protein
MAILLSCSLQEDELAQVIILLNENMIRKCVIIKNLKTTRIIIFHLFSSKMVKLNIIEFSL